MPTPTRIPSPVLDPKGAIEKFAGLIVETDNQHPVDPEPAPEAVAEQSEQPSPPATPPPETADTDETAPGDETLVELTIDGEPVEVSLQELKKQYSYQAHNTRKAQELAEKEARLEPDLRARLEQEVAADREQHRQAASAFIAALNELQGEPDWLELRKSGLSDADFMKQRADWEATKVQRERLRQHEQQLAQTQADAQQKAQLQYLRAEDDKLKAAVPEWADVEKGKAELAKLRSFVKASYGFSDEQVRSGFSSAAIVLLVRDAMKYRELKREPSPQTKAKVSPIKTARPGVVQRTPANKKFTDLVERSAKTGRQRDAMAAILEALPDE